MRREDRERHGDQSHPAGAKDSTQRPPQQEQGKSVERAPGETPRKPNPERHGGRLPIPD
jgi:hypothetical protein